VIAALHLFDQLPIAVGLRAVRHYVATPPIENVQLYAACIDELPRLRFHGQQGWSEGRPIPPRPMARISAARNERIGGEQSRGLAADRSLRRVRCLSR
jgi:hypothetical protein